MKRYIKCSSDSEVKYKIQEGMFWYVDGHKLTIVGVQDKTAYVEETWTAEDTREHMNDVSTYLKGVNKYGEEYIQSVNNERFKLYAGGAYNFEQFYDEEEDEDEYDAYSEYEPRSYSPSCPWNAPGMSVRDFM